MIFELLETGRENRKTAEELLKILNVEKREFYSELRKERRQGHFILSDKSEGGGYWLWNGSDYSELKAYYKTARSGAIDTLVTLQPVYKKLKKMKEGEESE